MYLGIKTLAVEGDKMVTAIVFVNKRYTQVIDSTAQNGISQWTHNFFALGLSLDVIQDILITHINFLQVPFSVFYSYKVNTFLNHICAPFLFSIEKIIILDWNLSGNIYSTKHYLWKLKYNCWTDYANY